MLELIIKKNILCILYREEGKKNSYRPQISPGMHDNNIVLL